MKKLTLLLTIFTCMVSLGAEEATTLPAHNQCHILERLVVAFPEIEQSLWNSVHFNEGEDGYLFEKWSKRNCHGVEESLSIVTSPWGPEGQVNVIDAIQTIAQCFKGHAEVIRRTKSEDEIAVALRFGKNWKFIRVISTPYALHIASYTYRGPGLLDPEKYLELVDQYAHLVY